MRFDPQWCPDCGGHPGDILEEVRGLSMLSVADNATDYAYGGKTDIFWDSQVPVIHKGKVTLCCVDCRKRWQATMTDDGR